MPIRRSVISALSALSLLSISGVAAASSHREAPAIANDPAADNTDTYAWVNGSNLIVVANYIGLELPEGGPNWAKFSDDVRYDVHVTLGDSLTDELTYQFQFTTTAPTNTGIPSTMATASQLMPTPAGGQEFFAQITGSGAFGQTYTVTQLTNGGSPTVVAQGIKVPAAERRAQDGRGHLRHHGHDLPHVVRDPVHRHAEDDHHRLAHRRVRWRPGLRGTPATIRSRSTSAPSSTSPGSARS